MSLSRDCFLVALVAIFMIASMSVPAHSQSVESLPIDEFGFQDNLDGASQVVGRTWIEDNMAVQGTFGFNSNDQNTQFLIGGEVQKHFYFDSNAQNHSVFVGGGLTYEDLDTNGDFISLYSPVGFEYEVDDAPITLRAFTTAAIINGDDDTSINFLRSSWLGVMYSF